MKQIFDAIRAHLAHKPRNYSYSTNTLRNLAFLERRLRGFSPRLETLCGLARLSESDVKLQENLRQALQLTLRLLAQDKSRLAEALAAGIEAGDDGTPAEPRSILKLHEKSGQLRGTALQLLREPHHLRAAASKKGRFTAQPGTLTYKNNTLTFNCYLEFYDPTNGRSSVFPTGPCRLENIDLDSLGGASDALLAMRQLLQDQLKSAQALPAFLRDEAEYENLKRAENARDERIREVFAALTPEDRSYLRQCLAHSGNSASLERIFTRERQECAPALEATELF